MPEELSLGGIPLVYDEVAPGDSAHLVALPPALPGETLEAYKARCQRHGVTIINIGRPETMPQDPIFQGRGRPLDLYGVQEEAWPPCWRTPEESDDADLFTKFAWLADDVALRGAINVWDNGLRMPDSAEGITAGLFGAWVRWLVGIGIKPGFTPEQVYEGFRQPFLTMVAQCQEWNEK